MIFDVAGTSYRTERPDARTQFLFLRRVMPILPALSALGLQGTGSFATMTSLADADEKVLSDAIDGSLALCERLVDGDWVPAWQASDSISLSETLDVLAHVVAFNFGPYFKVDRPDFRVTSTSTIPIEPVLMPNDLDWLYRPMMRGLCRYESLIDGTLHLEDLAEMNAVLDATDENQRRATKAAETPRR